MRLRLLAVLVRLAGYTVGAAALGSLFFYGFLVDVLNQNGVPPNALEGNPIVNVVVICVAGGLGKGAMTLLHLSDKYDRMEGARLRRPDAPTQALSPTQVERLNSVRNHDAANTKAGTP